MFSNEHAVVLRLPAPEPAVRRNIEGTTGLWTLWMYVAKVAHALRVSIGFVGQVLPAGVCLIADAS